MSTRVMRILRVLILILLMSSPIAAQLSLIDSLKQKLETLSEDDSLFVDTSNRVASMIYRTNPILAREYAERSLTVARNKKDKKGEALALRAIGSHYIARGYQDSAIVYFDDALLLFKEIDDQRGVATMAASKGSVYAMNDRFDLAAESFTEALRYYSEMESFNNVGVMYNNIANLFLEQLMLDEAIKNYKSSILYYSKSESKRNLALPLLNIGNAFQEIGELDSALIYLDKGLENALEYRNSQTRASILTVKGHIYRQKQEYETALEYYDIADEYYKEIGNWRKLLEVNYFYAEIYYVMGELNRAKRYNELVVEGLKGDDFGYARLKRDSYGMLSKIEADLGNYQRAYDLSFIYSTLNDSIKATENLEKLAELQLEFETEKKEQEIVLLEVENEAAQLKVLIVGAIGVFTIILILFFVWHIFRIKEKEKRLKFGAIKKELDNHGILIAEKDSFIKELISKLKAIGTDLKTVESKKQLNTVIDSILHNINLNEKDEVLFNRIEQINSGFFVELKKRYGSLSKNEKRLASLVQMDLSNKEIGSLLHINPRSVKQAKYRLKKKLELGPDQNLAEFLVSLESK